MGAGSFDAIIVGAGIGGLTLAHKLHQGGQRVLVLEKSASVGGWAQSNPIDGFLCEGGPNSTFATPQVIELIKQIGLEDDLCLAGPPSKRRFILLRRGAGRSSLLEVPGTFRTAVNSPLLNWQEKLRLAAEPLMPQSGLDDESVGAFARRRFGKGFTEKVLAPALSGIWAADIDRLSVRSALQRLFDFERNSGSVLRGALSTRKQPRRKRGETISFTAGMQQLAISLAGTLPADTVRCGCSVQRLKYDQNGVRVFAGTAEAASQQFNAKQLILTCDNISTAKLIEDAAPALAERIKEVPYSPMGVIHVSWNLDALDNFPGGFGFLATPTKGKPLLGALFNSACFPHRAPDGKMLVTCFVGGAVNPDLCDVRDEAITKMVLTELSGVLGARVPPKVVSSFVHRRAIPNYPVGHFELQQKISAFQASQRRVWILANWLSGLGVADRIEKAGELAVELLVDAKIEQMVSRISSAQN